MSDSPPKQPTGIEIFRPIGQALNWLQKKSSLFLVLPFLHLAVCFLYLATYFYIFGLNLSVFADAGDVFSVSFTNIVPFYVSMALGVTFGGRFDLESSEKIDVPRGCVLSTFVIPSLIIVIYLAAIIIAEFNRSGFVMIFMTWITLFLLVISASDWLFKEVTKGWKDRLFVTSWFVISLFMSAALQAQQDRYFGYKELAKDAPLCGGNAIVNKLGDQYLVVKNDNSRWLADKNCQLGAQITPPTKRTYPTNWQLDFWPF